VRAREHGERVGLSDALDVASRVTRLKLWLQPQCFIQDKKKKNQKSMLKRVIYSGRLPMQRVNLIVFLMNVA
jgi:hypothetical protein